MAGEYEPGEAFVAALGSVWVRLLLCFGAVFGAYCLHLEKDDFEPTVVVYWVAVAAGMLLWWGKFGLWFLAGFAAFLATIIFAYLFARDWRSTVSFFLVFTCATIFFFPLSIGSIQGDGLRDIISVWPVFNSQPDRVGHTLSLYFGVSVCYWMVAGVFRRFFCR